MADTASKGSNSESDAEMVYDFAWLLNEMVQEVPDQLISASWCVWHMRNTLGYVSLKEWARTRVTIVSEWGVSWCKILGHHFSSCKLPKSLSPLEMD
ncbi:hypothetical protein JHK82_052822 [Glycine max]|nr:hypothetical protein JHK86_052676 [Glycine max]KAG4927041.1 hypothetical protein JHK85_053527 [Glycine max]KAG5082667.1 hypothetical protein JHK84_052705 [Glycine max]KAG5085425.1 hypothetical protein JHK82_052822 [Glycine max]